MPRSIRFHVDLNLARELVDIALTTAAGDHALVSAAVVDSGGHLICFARADDAEIAGPTLAIDKAFTAVAHRCPTADLGAAVVAGGELIGMNANGSGRYVAFAGGLPLWDGDRVIGGIGVSGGTAAQDANAAAAARAHFREVVERTP